MGRDVEGAVPYRDLRKGKRCGILIKNVTGGEKVLKYFLIFLVSMVPLIELRLAVPMAVAMDLDYWASLAICVIGNMLPVPIIYFFARKVLL